jgi:hypothetical protein
VFVYLLPRFLSTDEENTSSLCLVVQVSAYMFTEQKLAGSQFFAHASLCDGKARGEADSLGTGLSVFSEQMSQARCLCEAEKRMKVYFSCIILYIG